LVPQPTQFKNFILRLIKMKRSSFGRGLKDVLGPANALLYLIDALGINLIYILFLFLTMLAMPEMSDKEFKMLEITERIQLMSLPYPLFKKLFPMFLKQFGYTELGNKIKSDKNYTFILYKSFIILVNLIYTYTEPKIRLELERIRNEKDDKVNEHKNGSFGKKRKIKNTKKISIPKELKMKAIKYGVRLTLKRGTKRICKSEKTLKKQIKNAIKRKSRK